MTKIKTNAAQYLDAINHIPMKLPLNWKIAHKVKRIRKLFGRIDDFDWENYNTHYRAEFEWNARFFTMDFDQVDFKIIDGRIYLLGDCKPIHLTHRCVWESIINLPVVSYGWSNCGEESIYNHAQNESNDSNEGVLCTFQRQNCKPATGVSSQFAGRGHEPVGIRADALK